jgi:hypothetical protein
MARLISSLLLVTALTGCCWAQSISFMRLGSAIVEARLKPVPAVAAERLHTLRAQFREAGCQSDQMQEQKAPGETLPNLICPVPGSGDGAIVVAARADYEAKSDDEAKVQWGGLAMLPLLMESVGAVASRHTLAFIAFTGKKGDRSGASWYVQQLVDAKKDVNAVILLDHIGRSPAAYSANARGLDAAKWLSEAARGLDFLSNPPGIQPSSLAAWADSGRPDTNDARPFQGMKIPAVTVFSRPAVHTVTINGIPAAEASAAVDPRVYNDTYLLLCVYLRLLDRELGKSQKSQKGSGVNAAR